MKRPYLVERNADGTVKRLSEVDPSSLFRVRRGYVQVVGTRPWVEIASADIAWATIPPRPPEGGRAS